MIIIRSKQRFLVVQNADVSPRNSPSLRVKFHAKAAFCLITAHNAKELQLITPLITPKQMTNSIGKYFDLSIAFAFLTLLWSMLIL